MYHMMDSSLCVRGERNRPRRGVIFRTHLTNLLLPTQGMMHGLSATTAALFAAAALHGAHAQYNAAPAQVGDVTMMGSSDFSWATGRFPDCPTECDSQPSSVTRRVHCQQGPEPQSKMLRGLSHWQPAELMKNDERAPGYFNYKEDDMTYTAPRMDGINLDDGTLDDWACAPLKAQTPFFPYNDIVVAGIVGRPATRAPPPPAGCATMGDGQCKLTMFDDYQKDRHWTALDHSVAMAFAWSPQAIFIGIKVMDDSHENGCVPCYF